MVFAALAAATVTTGIQGIAPALPAVQEALALSDSQIALFMSVYLLPSVLLAFPAGLLTDRLGRRAMYALSMGLFGAGGLVQVVVPTWPVIIGTRIAQGAAFGTVLALSITMIGDVLRGSAQVGAQGRRIVVMSAAEALFPVAAGALVAVSWYAPFGMQATALALALAGWFLLPPSGTSTSSAAPVPDSVVRAKTRRLRQVTTALSDRAIVALQVLAFLRFFFKFALVTYYPLLAVNERGLSALTVGVALGASSVLGTVCAALTGMAIRRIPPSILLTVSLLMTGTSLLLIAGVPTTWATVAGVVAYGVADGPYSVATNALVTAVAPPDARAAFVAFTGSVRNLGKLLAPLAFGATTLVMPAAAAFAVWGGVGVTAAVLPRLTRRFDNLLGS